MSEKRTALPKIVSRDEWLVERKELLKKEKEATRARDALAAERRRLPMVHIDKEYVFEGPHGTISLLDLFKGRRQLLTYHFMLEPGDEEPCPGCSMFTDNIGHLAHLHARDTSFALVSRAPYTQIAQVKERMEWTVPWYSTFGYEDFNTDSGAGTGFGLSVFLRDGSSIFQTYFTSERGVEALGSNWSFLDLTPFGRQETWEYSPHGWPQTQPYHWWRLHNKYGI
jgi:predicted dithiol-disulfide oxidoreductase (DUF899 family)